MKFVVVTEIHTDGNIDRWYYGTYDRARANEVALELGYIPGSVYHVVIPEYEVVDWGVKNLP